MEVVWCCCRRLRAADPVSLLYAVASAHLGRGHTLAAAAAAAALPAPEAGASAAAGTGLSKLDKWDLRRTAPAVSLAPDAHARKTIEEAGLKASLVTVADVD